MRVVKFGCQTWGHRTPQALLGFSPITARR
jgi:hypothetical protein